jgi:hypothetical protein
MKVINDDYMACDDCTPVIHNGDYTHLDYHYNEVEAQAAMERINKGMAEAGGDMLQGPDKSKDLEFSTRRCDCCGSTLHGRREHFYIVKFDEGETEIHDDIMTVDVGGYDHNGICRHIYDYHKWD